jgi:hypothetical protein
MIENDSRNVSLMVYQENQETSQDYIDVLEKTPYGIVDPAANNNKFICQFYIGSLQNNPVFIDDVAASFDIDLVDNQELIKIPTGFCTGRILYMRSYTDGQTKYIKFTDTVDVDPEENENTEASSIDIKIHELGFSFISQICKTERKEIAYVFMRDIKCVMMQTPKFKTYEFSIGHLQIDNQINFNILFPVLFRPSNRKPKNKPALQIEVTMKNDPGDIIFVESAKVDI